FIADDEVPIGRGLKFRLQFIRARRHVEPQDQAVSLDERISGYGRLDLIARENLEGKVEFFRKLVLPLLDETARGDNETAFQIAADQQLLDEQTGHDCLAGAGVVGEQK